MISRRLLWLAKGFPVSRGQETVNLSEITPSSAFTDEVNYIIDNEKQKEKYMKKLLLIALMVSGLVFVPMQRSDAQITVGIGGIGAGGYPGYGYSNYPYGYSRPYRSHGYYGGPSYYRSGGQRVYSRHHRNHYYRNGY